MKELNETEEKERLAEYGASLMILVIIWVGLLIFAHGLIWSFVKFLLTVVLIYGIRDFFIDYTLLITRYKKVDKFKKWSLKERQK